MEGILLQLLPSLLSRQFGPQFRAKPYEFDQDLSTVSSKIALDAESLSDRRIGQLLLAHDLNDASIETSRPYAHPCWFQK